MAQKQTIKAVEEDFQGLDYKASDLRKPMAFLRKADNASYSICDGLVKRAGFEKLSMPGLLLGTATYSYLDRTTGETKEEWLGFGCHAFRWKQYSFSFYSSAPLGCYAQIREDGTGKREFVVFDQASDLVVFTYTITDINNSLSNTIYALCVALQAAGFTVTYPTDTLVVQSNATGGAGTDTTVSFSYGTPAVGKFYTALNKATGLLEHVYIDNLPSGSSARLRRQYGWTYSAGDVWGIGGGYVGSIPNDVTFSGAGTLASPQVIPFYQWEGIPWSYYQGEAKGDNTSVTQDYLAGVFEESIRASFAVNPQGNGRYHQIQGENLNNKFYFAFPWDTRGAILDSLEATYSGESLADWATASKPFCYDGKYVYRAGIFRPIDRLFGISPSTTSGSFKYLCTISYLDNNGVEWESTPSRVLENNTGGTGAGTTVQYADPMAKTLEWSRGMAYFNTRSGFIRTNSAGPTFEVAGSNATLGLPNVGVGDKIYFRSSLTTTVLEDELIERTITAVNWTAAPPTITVDSALPYSTPAGSAYSAGLFLNIYRTKQFGSIFYLVKKIPFVSGCDSITYSLVDQVADSALYFEYIEPLPGEEHEMPPSGTVLTSHQGNMILAGAPNNPNTVNWSGIDGIEYFPRAFNSTDIPSTVKGAITACFSDSDDRLAVFKDKGYYEVNGDLATKAISVRTRTEGDYGISSQKSLQKVQGVVLGVGEKGVLAVVDGEFNYTAMAKINPLIQAKFKNLDSNFASKLNLRNAVAVNDSFNGQYILHIPSNVTADVSNITLLYNYQRDKWTALANPSSYYQLSGMTIFNDELHCTSYYSINNISLGLPVIASISASNSTGFQFQDSPRFGGESYRRKKVTGLAFSANDFSLAYPYNVITSFESIQEPSQFKDFDIIRVWFVPPYSVEGTTTLTTTNIDIAMQTGEVTLKSFADWDFSNISKSSSITQTLNADNTPYVDLKLRDKQARSVALQILTNNMNPFGITAVEYIYSLPYNSEAQAKYGR